MRAARDLDTWRVPCQDSALMSIYGGGIKTLFDEVTSRQRASAYAAAWPPLWGPDVGQEGPEPLGLDQDQ